MLTIIIEIGRKFRNKILFDSVEKIDKFTFFKNVHSNNLSKKSTLKRNINNAFIQL